MVYEDFTTYTEVDPSSQITVNKHSIYHACSPTEIEAYVYKDYGISSLNDFEHKVEVEMDAGSNIRFLCYWNVANASGAFWPMANDGETFLSIRMRPGSPHLFQLMENVGLTEEYDSFNPTGFDIRYYLTIRKSGTSLECTIYSSSGFVDSLSITLDSNHYFRYVYGTMSFGYNDQHHYGYTYNLDLQRDSSGGGKICSDTTNTNNGKIYKQLFSYIPSYPTTGKTNMRARTMNVGDA
jgi:hypothetical protein